MPDSDPNSDFQSSPEGVKAEDRILGDFKNLLTTQTEINATRRGSKEKTDSDFKLSYAALITPPTTPNKQQLKKRTFSIRLAQAIGITLIAGAFVTGDWEGALAITSLHILAGIAVYYLGIYIEESVPKE